MRKREKDRRNLALVKSRSRNYAQRHRYMRVFRVNNQGTEYIIHAPMSVLHHDVIPAQAGIHNLPVVPALPILLDSRLRGNDMMGPLT